MHGHSSILVASLIAGAAVGSVTSDARAQVEDLDTGYSVERFRLASDSQGVLDAESADVLGHLALEVGLWLGYADDPLNVYQEGAIERERTASLVSHRLGADLVAALALFDRLQLSVDIPLIISQDQSLSDLMGPASITSFSLGDIRPAIKIQLAFAERHHVDFAVRLAFSLPSAGDSDYAGDDNATFSPELALSAPLSENLRVVSNVGLRMREAVEVLDLVVDDELYTHLGAAYRVHERVELDATISAATPPVDLFGAFNRNFSELRGGVTVDVGPLDVFAALGAGTSEGFGTPDWRALAGVRVATNIAGKKVDSSAALRVADISDDSTPAPDAGLIDSDGDGLADADDGCPLVAEDYNGTDDDDGCPDGQAPTAAGDSGDAPPVADAPVTSTPAVDGAAPGVDPGGDEIADRDGDGIPDIIDNCPAKRGTAQHFGCADEQLVRLTGSSIEVLEKVYFETDKSAIRPRSYRLLRNLATVLGAHPELATVRVEGHTDDRGSDSYNMSLSKRRAEAVRNFLIAAGVEEGRLVVVGKGETDPVSDNATAEGQTANRRVEFILENAPSSTIQQRDNRPNERAD